MSTGTRLLEFAAGIFSVGREVNNTDNGSSVSLDSVEPGCIGVIEDAPEHSLLAPLGLRRGKKVKVVSKQIFGGPVVVEVDGRTSAVSRSLCDEIKVMPVDDLHAS
ncbi:FeoA family protein [Methanonatronarchaeum sp. AMET6-2]|uniref:FeoA family protein n=1 Tax=Methanonatronarchaeum sp. AMET6-2 TaxID=2933293 RepID=UPI0011F6A857|nr:FeoA family protein [Methanonatronarchaeum sp. AMET6-2]RZN60715.1 MAG: ferrous iron transport protein A [Methanonatronarchaeia archaeon]UOY09890.1 ferrous iron transport protein A [Methanonatronarchaeum sp. AMET6-2]